MEATTLKERTELRFDCARLDDHPDDAVLFFRIMMRLEYALKELGFASQTGTFLRVDWIRYANEMLGADFLQEIVDDNSLTVLLREPPSRQILLDDAKLSWDKADPIETTRDLLQAVWRVRNNLYHGGKSGHPDDDRNDVLIADSITVISKILHRDQELHDEFAGRY